jgi:hypothetical protein
MVQVLDDGTVAVSYYDFRSNTADCPDLERCRGPERADRCKRLAPARKVATMEVACRSERDPGPGRTQLFIILQQFE